VRIGLKTFSASSSSYDYSTVLLITDAARPHGGHRMHHRVLLMVTVRFGCQGPSERQQIDVLLTSPAPASDRHRRESVSERCSVR